MGTHYLKSRNLVRRYAATLFVLAGLAFAVTETSRTQSFPVMAATSPSSFANFESPQVHPLALTPDGTRLLAVNTPDNRLSVFELSTGSPVLVEEIPVGLEPVSVAARDDREA